MVTANADTSYTNTTTGALPRRNRVVETPQITCFQWSNGHNTAKRPGETRFVNHIGWFVEKGKSPSIDAVCASISMPTITIRFRRNVDDTKSNEVECWDFSEDVMVYPLTTGVRKKTVKEARAGRDLGITISAGIGTTWPKDDKSKTAVPVLVKPLVDAGCLEPLELPTRSNMGDVLLSALADHTSRVCDAVEALPQVAAKGMQILPWDLALPLGTGPEATWGKDLDSSTLTTFMSKHPQVIDEEYMKSIAAPRAVRESAIALWPGIQEWAREYAARSGQVPNWSAIEEGSAGPVIAGPSTKGAGVSAGAEARQIAAPAPLQSAPAASSVPSTPRAASASAGQATKAVANGAESTLPTQGYGHLSDAKMLDAIKRGLATDTDAAGRMPKPADDLTREEMEKLLPYLVRRHNERAGQA